MEHIRLYPRIIALESSGESIGPACAKEVLFFNEAYYGLYDVCMRMEREEQGREEYARRGGDRLTRMDQSLSFLQQQLPPGHALVRELEGYRDRQKKRLDDLARKN